MSELFNIEVIETAFFNYDMDGSESDNEAWQKRREEWAKFKEYLKEEAERFIEHEGRFERGCD